MSRLNGATFQDRQKTAAEARQALLAKFQSKPGKDDPAVVARENERKAVVEARNIRLAGREAEKAKLEAERLAQLAAEQAAQAERQRLDAIAQEQLRREEAAAELVARAEREEAKAALEVAQKSERDARYAARKMRKSERKQHNKMYG